MWAKGRITIRWVRMSLYIFLFMTFVIMYQIQNSVKSVSYLENEDETDKSESLANEIQDTKPRVLVVVSEKIGYSPPVRQVHASLLFLRAKHEIRWANSWTSNSLFDDLQEGRAFDLVVIVNLYSYSHLSLPDRTLLRTYCLRNSVGMLILHWHSRLTLDEKLDIVPLPIYNVENVIKYRINPLNHMWRITRDGGDISHGVRDTLPWVAFDLRNTSDISYDYVAIVKQEKDEGNYTVGYVDNGNADGVRKVVLGNSLSFWFHHSIFLDALHHLTKGLISLPMKRTVIVDIDDIFLGKAGKMNESDVQALLDLQNRVQQYVQNFKFNLAFSGVGYKKGSDTQIKGDLLLTKLKDEFRWFPHTYDHVTAQTIPTIKQLEMQMTQNKEFAKTMRLNVLPHYSVSPSHSGIYPILEPLYTAWRRIWDIQVTSTTMYYEPLYFNRLHYGFEYSGVQVLPRDSLNVYSTDWFWKDVKGGKQSVLDAITGGSIYLRYLYNTLMIAMTHGPNFASDRVANFAIETNFQFLTRWTNLEFITEEPMVAAKEYFNMYPEERNIHWENPCSAKLKFLYANMTKCDGYRDPLPDFLIIGPQKTGTTALLNFLTLNPLLMANQPLPGTFEEVQFFSLDQRYERGVEWYMDLFPNRTTTNTLIFEKSASYFSNQRVPRRVHALLPDIKLIVILDEPGTRAYSYYQHMREHRLAEALSFTFYDVITADIEENPDMAHLQSKCLHPGLYASHIRRWLQYYHVHQMLFLDGEKLRNDPVPVMMDFQHFLKVSEIVDYSKLLRFNEEKGFYCRVDKISNATKCLGIGKGRSAKYSPMTDAEKEYLDTYYMSHNLDLYKLLKAHHLSIPKWLQSKVDTYSNQS